MTEWKHLTSLPPLPLAQAQAIGIGPIELVILLIFVLLVIIFPAIGLFLVYRMITSDKRKTVLRCQCGYDLKGTIAAGQTVCPECGRSIIE